MSGNRFEFLEFGDSAGPAAETVSEEDVQQQGSGPSESPSLGSDNLPLSQVRVTDPRGYQYFLEQSDQSESERRHPLYSPQVTLGVAEVFGGRGTKAGQFNFPTGLAVDGSGVLFIADSYNHRVQRITPNGGVAVIGGRGAGHGQFLSPQGIATDAAQAFYVVEQGNHRVQKFSGQGVLELVFGRVGHGTDELHGPTGIAVAPGTGNIYVADTGNSRVQRFDSEGNYLATIGGPGSRYPPLLSPQALTVDSGDNLYVADTFAHRIVQYDPVGRLVAGFRAMDMHEPRALACDLLGVMYVADTTPADAHDGESQGRLQALDRATGQTRASVITLSRTGPMKRPQGLAVSSASPSGVGGRTQCDVYVADTMHHRILRFIWN